MVSWERKVLFHFWLIIIRSGCLAEIMWSVCMSKSQKGLCVSFSRTDAVLCIYHFFVWSNSNFLHNFQMITSHTQSCLVLYSFCANLLHSLIIWLTFSSLSPHNLHLLFFFFFFSFFFFFFGVLSIPALIWLVRCFVLLLGENQFLS